MNINDLYQRALTEDKKAESELFQKLLEGFRVFLYQRVWNKDEIEDILQMALTTIASEYKQVDITSSFSAWAYKVVENRFLAYIQTKRREAGRYVELSESDCYGKSWIPEHSLKEALLKCLRKVGYKNRQYARILSLTYQGYSVMEICDKMKISKNQSYVILSRARSTLRECLKKGNFVL